MTGKGFIDSLFYDLGKIQVLTTDTYFRLIALNWCNRILRDINAREEHWSFLEQTATFPTIAGIMTYDPPDDIDGNKYLSLRQTATPAKLRRYTQERLDLEFPNPTEDSGNPLRYIPFADGLKLHPVPSSVITITERYLKKITILADNDVITTELPEKYNDVVINGMEKYAFKYFPKFGNARDAVSLYEAGIVTMQRDNVVSMDADYISQPHSGGLTNIRNPHFDTSGAIGEV